MKVGIPVQQKYNKLAIVIGLLVTTVGSIVLWVSDDVALGITGFVLNGIGSLILLKFASKGEVSRPYPEGPTVITSHGFYQGKNAIQQAIDELNESDK